LRGKNKKLFITFNNLFLKMVKVSVLSPIHNEEKAIEELVERVTSAMRKCCGNDWEYLLVDDASKDKSLEMMERIAKKNKNLKVVKRKIQGGQTGGFKSGFDKARGDIIITIDGDLEVLPEDLPLFVEKMNKGYDLVNGIRENNQHPFWMKLVSRIYNILMLIFFNNSVLDSASNFTAFKAKFVKGLKLKGNDHRYIVPIAVMRGANKIGEVVVRHKRRFSGKSKYKPLPKYIKGFPELFITWLRIKRGCYNS